MTTKPKPKAVERLDYNECRDYLEAKHGYEERDYAGRRKGGRHDEDKPYQDFWHFVCDKAGFPGNGSEITMTEWWGENAEDWQKTILGYYLDEFGTGPVGEREATFWVEW